MSFPRKCWRISTFDRSKFETILAPHRGIAYAGLRQYLFGCEWDWESLERNVEGDVHDDNDH